MAIQRVPPPWSVNPIRTTTITLFNTPGTGQYKYCWFAIFPRHTGTLRELAINLSAVSGSPTLSWWLYDTVPPDGNINILTPVASGSITGIASAGWQTLTTNANLSVTRGQPFALKLACTAGTSLDVRAGGFTLPSLGITQPGSTVYASADDATYQVPNSSYLKNAFAYEMTVEDALGTHRFLSSFSGATIQYNALDGTSKMQSLNFRLGRPVVIGGFRAGVVPELATTGIIRCEIRRCDSNFNPIMTGSPLGSVEYQFSIASFPGNVSGVDALFPSDVLVDDGNFSLIYGFSSFTSGSVKTRFWTTEGTWIQEMFGGIFKSKYSSDGGTTWSDDGNKLPVMDIVWRHYADSYSSGGGKKIIPAPILGGI